MAWFHKYHRHTTSGQLDRQVENLILYGDMDKAAQGAKVLREQRKQVKELIEMDK